METYSEGGVSIQYPALSNLSDSGLEKKINEMLRTNAIAVAKAKGLPKEGSTLDVKATVESSNLKRLVAVSYTLLSSFPSGLFPSGLSHSGCAAGRKPSWLCRSRKLILTPEAISSFSCPARYSPVTSPPVSRQ